MADEHPRQIPEDQQGQAGQPAASMTRQTGPLAGGAGEQGAQPGSQYGGVVPAWQQGGPQPGQVTASPPAAPVAVRQSAAEPVPRQAARQEQPTPALEAAMIERREGGFGGVRIRIQERGLAAAAVVGGVTVGATYVASQATQSPAGIVGAGIVAGTMSLAAFLMGNRQQTEEAIRRAVEKEGHVKVDGIEEGSLLVQVKFLSMAGYWVIRALNEKIHQGTDRTCLQLLLEDELQRIGWTGPIQVGLEGWWFAGEGGHEDEQEDQEEAAGTEQEAGRWEWTEMLEKQPVPPSLTTEGDSGLPEDVSSVAAMSITSAEEVEEGSLKRLRARLQKRKDSPTAQRYITAYRSWEEGAEILTSSGYTDLGGLKALVRGFMQLDIFSPSFTSRVLYEQPWLKLYKAQLNQLITSQLQADPTDSTCLLLTALQLPHGDSRVQALQQVVAAILQHGPGDWLYQHLNHIYCYLGWAIWMARPRSPPTEPSQSAVQPATDLPALAEALAALASSLMHKHDHLNTVYVTAFLSKEVSETEAIRQFEHFLGLAPECYPYVPDAHYRLATLFGQQQDRQKVIHHFNRGQKTEDNRLPVFTEVQRSIKDPAWKAYETAMTQGS